MLVAVVVPHEEHTNRWAHQNGHSGSSFSEVCSLKQLQDYILLELKSTAERNKVMQDNLTNNKKHASWKILVPIIFHLD